MSADVAVLYCIAGCGRPGASRRRMPSLCAECRPVSKRSSQLKHRYGMTVEQYDEMLAAQGGGCAVCGGLNSSGQRLHVDHDHSTGRVRGLLCFKCNSALGKLHDDPALIRALLRYAEEEVCAR